MASLMSHDFAFHLLTEPHEESHGVAYQEPDRIALEESNRGEKRIARLLVSLALLRRCLSCLQSPTENPTGSPTKSPTESPSKNPTEVSPQE